MARTPLMRALQRLAREHQAASMLGIEVEELHERECEGRISRREFVKRTGAVGAAVAVAGPMALAKPASAAGAPRIAIIGGGIAGLTAALTLNDKGVYADLYESSGRLGGRMHSDWTEFGHGFWDNAQQAELCGELIWPSGAPHVLSENKAPDRTSIVQRLEIVLAEELLATCGIRLAQIHELSDRAVFTLFVSHPTAHA